MLVKRSVNWEDIEVKKIKHRGNVEFVLLLIALVLVVIIGLFLI